MARDLSRLNDFLKWIDDYQIPIDVCWNGEVNIDEVKTEHWHYSHLKTIIKVKLNLGYNKINIYSLNDYVAIINFERYSDD